MNIGMSFISCQTQKLMVTHVSAVVEVKISSNHSDVHMTITQILCSRIANGRVLSLELNAEELTFAFYVYIVAYGQSAVGKCDSFI